MKIITFICIISVVSLNTFPQSSNKREMFATSFNVFFEKFKKDSTFQISSTIYPFKVIDVDDEGNITRFIQKKDWKYISFEGKNVLLKQVWFSKTKVDVQFSIQDTGILVDHFFEYRNGKWWHVYAKNQSD